MHLHLKDKFYLYYPTRIMQFQKHDSNKLFLMWIGMNMGSFEKNHIC
jgi:hypothetical protein